MKNNKVLSALNKWGEITIYKEENKDDYVLVQSNDDTPYEFIKKAKEFKYEFLPISDKMKYKKYEDEYKKSNINKLLDSIKFKL